MEKNRNLFKKITDAKGTYHAKMGTTKDRNGMDLRKEDITKRWQEHTEDTKEHTEERYKKDLNDPDNHDGVITHLKPYILECEVKWTFSSVQSLSRVRLFVTP